jgi:hypothetical protein
MVKAQMSLILELVDGLRRGEERRNNLATTLPDLRGTIVISSCLQECTIRHELTRGTPSIGEDGERSNSVCRRIVEHRVCATVMLEHQVQRIVSACPVCSRKKTFFFKNLHATTQEQQQSEREKEGLMNAMHKYLEKRL